MAEGNGMLENLTAYNTTAENISIDHALVSALKENQGVETLLRGIIYELKIINTTLSRQKERTEGPSTRTNPAEQDKQRIHRKEASAVSPQKSSKSTSGTYISADIRTRHILHEALKRYKLNSVPFWSCLYGTHIIPADVPTSPEELSRNAEWFSIVGDLWSIPHDNRINLCFRAALDDNAAVVRVRNFVSQFHKLRSFDSPKGNNFNVWDWFDTGLYAYWYPGNKRTVLPSECLPFPVDGVLKSNASLPISNMIAPWRRLINFQGLTSLSSSHSLSSQEELTDEDLCPFLFKTKGSIFQDPMDEILWRVIKCHLSCLRVSFSDHSAMQTKSWVLFHVTFYEILKFNPQDNITELWPSGELHSDHYQHQRSPRNIRESALTILAVPSLELPGPGVRAIFWTMICMRPNQFPHLYYSESRDDLSRGCTHEMIDDMSGLVSKGILTVITKWEEIVEYFDTILVEKKGLLHPEYHDSLLTDDGMFTRSKKYFWAIEFLKEVETSISDNITQTKQFMDLMDTNRPLLKTAYNAHSSRIKKHQIALKRLEELRKTVKCKQDEAKALRDGLFNASAVIESRAATQLGENIKLLTYVSIFFLPLSFCTSLWSISNSIFSLSSLATALPIVAVVTYTIVLNLSNIINLFYATGASTSSSFKRFIDSQIRSMQDEPDRTWRERGIGFEKFTSLERAHRPSKWRFLQFTLRQLLLKIWRTFMCLLEPMRGLRRGRESTLDNGHLAASPLDLRDVHVHVQEEVNAETMSYAEN